MNYTLGVWFLIKLCKHNAWDIQGQTSELCLFFQTLSFRGDKYDSSFIFLSADQFIFTNSLAFTSVHQYNLYKFFVVVVYCLISCRKVFKKNVCIEPTLRMKGVMFSLKQLKVVAMLGTWDPCLSAGIGMEPAAPLRARCCFIYLKAQVTFLEEHRRETCLRGLSALPLFSSVTYLPVKDEIESHHPGLSPDCQRNRPNSFIFCNYETVLFLKFQLEYECPPST